MFTVRISQGTEKAMRLLGLESYPFTERQLRDAYWAKSKEFHSKDDEKMRKINLAKEKLENLATPEGDKSIVKEEVNELLAEYMEANPFAIMETCNSCLGTGERSIDDTNRPLGKRVCPWCNGEKFQFFTKPCYTCEGTGKFSKNRKDPVPCRVCRGTGIYKGIKIDRTFKTPMLCNMCYGVGYDCEGYEQKKVMCPDCKGMGKKELKLFNPVIPNGAIL
jgi:DnaJ-class molecular chaperone